jgi:ribosomal protein S18 acetylase RimI-like enzyme
MSGGALHGESWSLREAAAADIEALMHWFPTADDVMIWGGPSFRNPFTRDSFFKDVFWDKMASYCLRDAAGEFVAFGQLYDRDGRIHLARLIVRPDMRSRGIGRRLIEMLMEVGATIFPRNEYSLFVYRENLPAYECYKSLGFVVQDYPDDMPHADVCYYLTRPAKLEES